MLIWFAWINCPPPMLCKLCIYVQLGTTNLVNIIDYISVIFKFATEAALKCVLHNGH